MRADAYPLDSVLRERQQWVVPVYQRHYEWEISEDKQLPKLWDDLRDEALERLEKRIPFPHYFGAIIYAEPANQPFGAVRQRFLVDGQQRITTFQLVLAALKEVAGRHKLTRIVDVVNSYLFNEKSASMLDAGRERFKLWPSAYDRALYQQIVEHPLDKIRTLQKRFFYKNGNLITGQAPNLLRAYCFLLDRFDAFIRERGEEENETLETVLDALLAAFLSGFQIVVIQLDQNDDAQEIFASLNGLGKPLSPFDLIRNDIFHRARKTGENDEELFDSQWKTFEQPFWSEQVRQGRFKRARADHLIAHAVVAETAREVNVGKIAAEYQRYARERSFPTVAAELDVLLTHAETYRAMETAADSGLTSRISEVVRIWDLTTFHPLIFAINASPAADEEKAQLFRLLESYIVRRELCGLTTKNYNKVVVGFVRTIREGEASVSAFAQYLASLTGDISRMPNDLQVAEAFARAPAYERIPTPRLRFILQQIEYGKRSKFDEVAVSVGNLTIEHVMPQKWAQNWPLPNGETVPVESPFVANMKGVALGDEAKALMESRNRLINTFGNLTLLTERLNPSVGNAGWGIKRDKLGQSLLALNRSMAKTAEWNEAAIEHRAAELAETAATLWPMTEGISKTA